MAFTSEIRWIIMLCGLLLLISSCSTAPGSSRSSGTGDSVGRDQSELVVDSTEESPRILRPNPYLENAPQINRSVETSFDLGLAAMELENWPEAELIFQELTVTEPRLSGPWVNLGIIYNQAEKFESAESAWKTAIEVNPANTDAYNHLAILKREQGDFVAAEGFFLNSLAKWPDNPEAHCNLGILYDLYMGLWPQALAEYQECADLTEEPSRQLRGWIIDMERRIQSQATE